MSSTITMPQKGVAYSAGISEDAKGIIRRFKDAVAHYGEPISQTSTARRFADLAQTWKSDTRLMSSSHQIALNPAYQAIIAMGEKAIPYILADLKRGPHHWFWALAVISGANPVPAEARGDVPRMAEAWLSWGRQHNLTL